MKALILFGILTSTYMMMIAKRTPSLIRSFRYQSLGLFLATLFAAIKQGQIETFVIAGLLLALKVLAIPHFLFRTTGKIKSSEDLGLFINPQLSLLWALGFTYLAWIFASRFIPPSAELGAGMPASAFFVVMAGMFLMIFRMTALAQIVGILVMENGLFLLASTVSGGMPFIVEIAIFFDVFVSVLIMGVFVYRINRLFTHIDVNKLSRLKG